MHNNHCRSYYKAVYVQHSWKNNISVTVNNHKWNNNSCNIKNICKYDNDETPAVTTGPVTASTTTVVETTTSVPAVTTTGPETTVVTSKPSASTTTTQVPSTSTEGTTATPAETTSEKTTVRVGTTTPFAVTTGPVTTPTTAATSIKALTTTGPETTVGVVTGKPQTTSSATQPSILNATTVVTATVSTGKTAEATTTIGPLTQTLQGSTNVYTTGATTTRPTRATVVSTVSLFIPTPTLCVCIFNGTSHHPGALVYNVTDGLGWCYVGFCNASCKVEVQSSLCSTTPIPSTASTTSGSAPPITTIPTSTSTLPTTPSTTTLDCYDVSPPRKNGDSWKVSNCTTATCINGNVTEIPTPCPTAQPICVNGRQAVKVYDDNGCCPRNECQCVCSAWGGSHHMTFDGKYYSFNETCSYYLVKEIITKYNLTIIVNKAACDPSDSSFCTQALTVMYQSHKVLLTQSRTSGTAAFVVYVNEKRIYTAYKDSVLHLTGTDMVITLEIPMINTKVVYTNSSFTIDIPYSLFHDNTEGQCGTCDNSQSNDCRFPNGQVESCSLSAVQWLVPGTPCVTTTTPPTTTTAPRATSKPTYSITKSVCESTYCDLLSSSVFEPCHKLIPPDNFKSSCVSDNCNNNNTCSSLEAYATECSKAGVCIDWRNATNGQCEHKCPDSKVYLACGHAVETTCNCRYNEKFQAGSKTSTMEGCFCPQGTVLFNSVYNKCVPSCDCVGPDGKPKQYGETWTSGCKTCVCDKDSMSIQCQPVQCPLSQSPNCSEPCQQLVNKTDGCCTTQSCECNLNQCPTPITCNLGFRLNVTNGTCCQSHKCVPKGVCVYDMTEYKPGARIPTPETTSEPPLKAPPKAREATLEATTEESFTPGPCQECYCGPQMDPTTQLNQITCKPIVCNTSCSEGYEYQTIPGRCCGMCVQRSCFFTTPDNTTHIIEVNNTFVPANDRCVQYTCEKISGVPMTKEIQTTCPPFNSLNCKPGTETTDANGCCKTCRLRGICQVQSKQVVIMVNDCKSKQPVNMTSCAGHCGSSSEYSAKANTTVRQCECCQEATTSQKQVELYCSSGAKVQYSYTVVETCGCSKAKCGAGTTANPRGKT
ncbi:intestinal mucin-like protein [Chelmon rostratus]|uniref:intestinal mucin-like protein n=1 Tax=Chelmon rostratus TaxID=109905 RepID=UPI001BE5F268|nr:intestinal mucin-like protein [Chelmon rostratus]